MFRNFFNLLVVSISTAVLSTLNLFSQTPNIIIHNADIRTMDKLKPRAEAVAITDNKISSVGSNVSIKRLVGANTKVIDAKGKLVIPGFNDSHVHFFYIGSQFFSIDFKNTKNADDVMDKIRFNLRFLPNGKWVLGSFQVNDDSALSRFPTKQQIDEITPNRPVFIFLKGANIAFANSYALNLAGIDKFDTETKATGILRGLAVNLVRNLTPSPLFGDVSAILEASSSYSAAMGVTSVQDVDSDNRFETYQALEKQGKLKNRIYDCIPLSDWQKLADAKIIRATGTPMLRGGCLKHFSDGDYETLPILFDQINAADRADLQVMMHAIGSSANDIILTIYERILKSNGLKDRRFRIEHAHNFRSTDLKRFVNSKTIASMQPYLFFDGSGNDTRLYRQMINNKALLSFGSDANIIDLNPMFGIYAAVFGENSTKGVSVEEAVRAYTLDSAYAEFQENVKGSITVGKLADLIILSENIFTIPKSRIKEVQVLQTIMDGKIVYQDNSWTNQKNSLISFQR